MFHGQCHCLPLSYDSANSKRIRRRESSLVPDVRGNFSFLPGEFTTLSSTRGCAQHFPSHSVRHDDAGPTANVYYQLKWCIRTSYQWEQYRWVNSYPYGGKKWAVLLCNDAIKLPSMVTFASKLKNCLHWTYTVDLGDYLKGSMLLLFAHEGTRAIPRPSWSDNFTSCATHGTLHAIINYDWTRWLLKVHSKTPAH